MSDKKKTGAFSKSKITSHAVLSKGRRSALAFLSKLSKKQRLHLFITASPVDRMRLLSIIPDPKSLVRHVPEEEIYWTIKELGIKKTFDLLKVTSSNQLQFIFDVEWWEADSLNTSRIFKWLKAMLHCGAPKIEQWFKSFDFDLIILTFKQFIKVYKPDEGTDDYGEATENLPTFTLDGVYFIEIIHKNTELVLKNILKILIALDTELYWKIMELVIWGIEPELEYDCFCETQRRLEGKGIPEYDEARTIYRFIPADEVESLPKKEVDLIEKTNNIKGSFYPIRLATKEEMFLTRVLKNIDNYAVLDDLSINLAHVTNKIMVADHFSMYKHNSFKDKLTKTVGFINIGLEFVSSGDEQKGAEKLKEYWLENLFQIGWSRVFELKKRIKTLQDQLDDKFPQGINVLDFPLKETIQGVVRDDPMFFVGENILDCGNYRNFKFLSDVKIANDRICSALFLVNLVTADLGLSIPDSAIAWSGGIFEISLGSMFMTGYANNLIKGNWEFSTLDFASLKIFLDKVFNESSGNAFLKTCVNSVIENIRRPFLDEETAYLDLFLRDFFARLTEEYKNASEDGFFDIIDFKILWIEHFHT